MQRALRNLTRFPQRTVQSLVRLCTSTYWLETEARAAVKKQFGAQRIEELDTVPGTSSIKECCLLAHLAMQAPSGGCVVEIGAYKGRSTAWLVEASNTRPQPLPVISIDPHNGPEGHPDLQYSWDDFQKTVHRFHLQERGLQFHRAYSHDLGSNWQRPISMLWIDGSHDYPHVLQDILDFSPAVIPGGYVVFDDASGGHFPGVEQAIAEQMFRNPQYRHLGTVRHFAIFQKLNKAAA